MKEIDFQCEVLTPLFLAGAYPRGRPELRGPFVELRSPAVRGAMRYWYRALIGGSTDFRDLKELEARVFGDTGMASPIIVSMRVNQPLQEAVESFKRDRAIRMSDGSYLPTGKDYLLWSMAASGQPGTPRYQLAREYIKPGTKFTITLRSRGLQQDEILKKAVASLWLVANLGALGARARRGAGSIVMNPKDASNVPIFFKECSTINELQAYLSDGIRQCLVLISQKNSWRTFTELPEYDILAPEAAKVWVISNSSTGWETALQALEGIGSKLRDYRGHRSSSGIGKADHDAVLKWLESGEQPPEIKRAVFGLPLPFRYSEGGPSDVIIAEQINRRASPLHIRITRLATDRYVGVLTLFKSQFLEKGKMLQLQTRKWKAPPPIDYKVIENFVGTFEVVREIRL